LAEAAEPAKVICEAALDPAAPDALCAATLDLFLTILGAEAGNLALKVLATGGVYLGGGIPMNIAPALDDGAFMASFRAKGRFAGLLGRVPVHLIVRQAALFGTASYGLDLMASP
jgi:glucokinase